MAIIRFEDMVAWQKAQQLAVEIYKVFAKLKDYGFKDQICRAAVSVSNNLAEGFDRKSDREFIRFIHIAKGSCSEVKSMLYLAEKLNYIDKISIDELLVKIEEIQKMLSGLKRSMTSPNT